MTDGRQVFLQEHEVLLLLGASVKSLSVADGLFGGELVLIEQSAAAPCRLTVNAARIKTRHSASGLRSAAQRGVD